ncbi:MAG TPA: twin-arginine translocation signal domain-containing protein, partial [Chthonomonadales bacterium]|nr:twin-arginine translocation signal domain-containing protein [Chthonomonadales bacterium]
MDERTSSPQETSREQARTTGSGISRRGFLKGAGITAAGTALLDGLQTVTSQAQETATAGVMEYGPGPAAVTLKVNGRAHQAH